MPLKNHQGKNAEPAHSKNTATTHHMLAQVGSPLSQALLQMMCCYNLCKDIGCPQGKALDFQQQLFQ